MAPSPRPPEGTINHTPVYDEFIAKLAVYHQKRGTNFEPVPKVTARLVDLKKLFDAVVEAGGYDKVCETKLAWRKICESINFGSQTDAGKAFGLKTAYYKNLAAYEISTIHGKEPPPKEILEEVSAAGGALLTRTLENYRPPGRRETGHLGNGESENSGDDGTPVRDRGGSEETPGSGSGRATRGLRQAPPQRVLFQPEATPRQTRQPQPAISSTSSINIRGGASSSYNPSSNPESLSFTVNSYEPRQPVPLTLRPVTTPGNNPAEFAKRQRILREQAAAANGRSTAPANNKIMLPGTGFDGPNIYQRCLFSLKSGTPAEQDYALHHLVKISMERGDKYRFESFPGLAEALIEKVLEVSSLFYDVKWRISYDESDLDNVNTLNGLQHASDILERIAGLVPKPFDDNIQTADFSDQLLMINEAALTLRNMVMLEENAAYVSELYPLRDFLSIALNLPNFETAVELKHYALEIAEQLTRYMSFEPEDPLYLSLLAQIQQADRGAILTSLRAISRISMNLAETNRLKGIPVPIINNLVDWLLLDDEELLHACLDLLYQYTAVVDNVDAMSKGNLLDRLVNQLVRLLTYGSRLSERPVEIVPSYRTPGPQEIPLVPTELMEQLLKLEETERSSQWLRCLFEEDPDESITQILLWQSYQSAFSQALNERGLQMLAAAEFIKNVSATFADKASAQVQSGPVQKFIIKGIRIRDTPVDFNGKPYSTCKWINNSLGLHGINRECGEYVLGPDRMFDHIMVNHVGGRKTEDGKFENGGFGEYDCHWKGCGKYPSPTPMKLSHMARHVQQHVQRTISPAKDSPDSGSKSRPTWYKPGIRNTFAYHDTSRDDRNEAAGIPLTAALVLRNLLRTLPKTEANEKAMEVDNNSSLVDRLFKPVESKMHEIASHNRTLNLHINQLLQLVREAA